MGMKWFYLLFAILLMLISWEGNHIKAAISKTAVAEVNQIPDESIRLRIIANSDSVQDQLIKRKVRDRVVEHITLWADDLQSMEQAREMISSRIPELQEIVKQELTRNGFKYNSQVELGNVPFPTKMYGNEVYPAGSYEALRITLGEAKGENWWCVLFPPLCFVDFTSSTDTSQSVQANESADVSQENQVEIGFFLWEWLIKLKELLLDR
jgi:stage II sporulation protein R